MRTSIPLSAFAAATFVALGFSFTSSAPAQASSLLDKCNGSSRAMVEKCCTAWVKRNGKTQWMIESGATCASAVSCSGGNGKRGTPTINSMVAKPKNYCQLNVPPGSYGSGPTTPKPQRTFVGKP